MIESQFNELLDRYNQGLCTPEEKQQLERWMDNIKEGPGPFKSSAEKLRTKNSLQSAIYVKAGIEESKSRTLVPVMLKIASAIALLVVTAYGVWTIGFNNVQTTDFVAGTDKATLTLSNGATVPLNGMGTAIPTQGGVQVQNDAGSLSYIAQANSTEIVYNTVTIPRAGQYHLALADGSKVWLNAESSLTFPTSFSGNERVVKVTGEAYFEIAHNKAMPFKVQLPSGYEVEVLGTRFNVMAYGEEDAVKTTLLEGSVRITSGDHSALLSPNQQAQISKDGKLTTENVNVSQAVAWKDNKFIFRNTALSEIMRQMERWYNVEVVYEDDVRSLRFGGVVSRKENASAVLKVLELTGNVKFETQGNKIIVRSGKKIN